MTLIYLNDIYVILKLHENKDMYNGKSSTNILKVQNIYIDM